MNVLPLLLIVVTALTSTNGQFSFSGSGGPSIDTSYGRIKGTTLNIGDGKSVNAYIGVPYAASPTRGNRFRDPQPVVRWTGEYLADKKVMCPQTEQRIYPKNPPSFREDEDCLYLNIYTPNRPGIMQNYPVVFYIHGGDFKSGGKDFYKPNLLLKHDVILVVPNYRLGVLGFLGTDDYHCPGNFGLKDQIAALRWVSSEIHRFNGDRNAITVMGHDAGAISAHILMMTKDARDLFNKTIIAGGSAFTPWAFQEDPAWQARRFGWEFGCKGWSRDIVRCLRERSVTDLTARAREYEGYWFRPVIDRNITYGLLTDYPERLYQLRQVTPVPLLAGLNMNEGSLEYYYRTRPEYANQPGKKVIEQLLRPFMKRYVKVEIVASSVEYHYFQRANRSRFAYGRQNPGFPGGFLTSPNRDEVFIKILGDFLYNAPTDKALRLHSQLSDAYLYLQVYKGDKSFGPLQRNTEISRDAYGVSHMDDVFLIFTTEYDPQQMDLGSGQASSELLRTIALFSQNNMFFTLNKYTETSFSPNYIPNRALPPINSVSNYWMEDANFWNTIINDIIEITATPPPYFPYHEYEGFKAATWSLVSLLILALLLLAILVFVIYRKNREERRSLDFLKAAREKDADARELEKL